MKRAILAAATVSIILVATSAGARVVDRSPPSLAFATQEGAVLVSAPVATEQTRTSGRVYDRSGIKSLQVFYCTGSKNAGGGWTCNNTAGWIGSFGASLSCSSATRCAWTSELPLHPGQYLAFARATDRLNNAGSIGPIQIVVV